MLSCDGLLSKWLAECCFVYSQFTKVVKWLLLGETLHSIGIWWSVFLQIKPKRSSGDAEENILRFLKACTALGVKEVRHYVCRRMKGSANLPYKGKVV